MQRSTESRDEELNRVLRLAGYRSRDGKTSKTADEVAGISKLKTLTGIRSKKEMLIVM